MKKQFTFLLLAAALLVSVPSWAQFVTGEGRDLDYYELPEITTFSTSNSFGTICVPERIVAVQGIVIYDVHCVDVDPLDTTEVARLVVEEHKPCDGWDQFYRDPQGDPHYYGEVEAYCPYGQGRDYSASPCERKIFIDWISCDNEDYPPVDYRMKAGGAYFYTACGSTTMKTRLIYVDTDDVASAPVSVNGFWGTFEKTTINSPVTVLTQDVENKQYLEQVTKVTMPAHRGYFKGNFECVPWRYNTKSPNFTEEFQKEHGVTGTINPRHNPCTGEIYDDKAEEAPVRVMFNVGRNATTGLYQVDFEHPIYLNQETNKRIENGQLILEAADGTKYNAFGQRVQ